MLIAAIAGSLDGITAPAAQKALDAIVAQGATKVAVDCSALDYISSAGLRMLLGLVRQLATKGGSWRTFGLNQTVNEVFEISGFSTIFRVLPGESEALAGF